MNLKERGTTLALAGVVTLSVALGAAGGTMLSSLGAHAQTPAASPAAAPSTSGGTAAASGTFRSNEDPTHEKGESAAREAQEDAGQRPTTP